MKQTPYRSCAIIDRSALRHNFHTVKALLRPGCKVLSVVKADGYGH
ncbi:MAG: alanine racemase, partial [Clostridia bacterium]|nr:alanine racemase [Clostridia bacterium]